MGRFDADAEPSGRRLHHQRGLGGGPVRDDRFREHLGLDLAAVEEASDVLLHLGNLGRPPREDHVVDVLHRQLALLQSLAHGDQQLHEHAAAQLL
mmetsp:Transcript_14329/g.28910  ORF Transcript_14329/g.28910 Transcript_14329/m.28910 type:complete len:95 (+) Transcript_14329:986-1270(+)